MYMAQHPGIQPNMASDFNFKQASSSNAHQRSNIEEEANSTKMSYQPVPDDRFYTKANFFTMDQRNEAVSGMVSSGDESSSRMPQVASPHAHTVSQGMYGMDQGAFPQKTSVMSHPASGGSRGRIDQESLMMN